MLARGCRHPSGVGRYFYLSYIFGRLAIRAIRLDDLGTDRESARSSHKTGDLVDRHLHLDGWARLGACRPVCALDAVVGVKIVKNVEEIRH